MKAVRSQRKPRDAAVNFHVYVGPIEFYNDIVRFPSHSTAFLLAFVCRLQ